MDGLDRCSNFVKAILKWGRKHRRNFPWRTSPHVLDKLIAEVFLQRTPAERVAKKYNDLVSVFSTSISKKEIPQIVERFKDLGLGKRIHWLIESINTIDTKHGGLVPNKFEDLIQLPGIGLYTANAVLCFGFGDSVPLVDTNISRILNRFFGISKDSRISKSSPMFLLAETLVPKKSPEVYNYALIDFGSLVCKKRPKCPSCPLLGICPSKSLFEDLSFDSKRE